MSRLSQFWAKLFYTFDLNYHPDDENFVRCNSEIKKISIIIMEFQAAVSIYLVDEPYMVSVISKYPLLTLK